MKTGGHVRLHTNSMLVREKILHSSESEFRVKIELQQKRSNKFTKYCAGVFQNQQNLCRCGIGGSEEGQVKKVPVIH